VDLVGDDLRSAVELVFRLAERTSPPGPLSDLTPRPPLRQAERGSAERRGRDEGISPVLDLLFEEWLAPARFSERPGEPPRTAAEALRLFEGALPGRRGAWRRSDR
jgi:hypothetical protein